MAKTNGQGITAADAETIRAVLTEAQRALNHFEMLSQSARMITREDIRWPGLAVAVAKANELLERVGK